MPTPPAPSTPCTLWTGSLDRQGYGRQWSPETDRPELAHRLAYLAAIGPIPDDRPHLDHLCGVPACVRPDHLEPVTQAENNRRQADRRTHCRKGHPWVAENVITRGGKRRCRVCLWDWERANGRRR